MVEYRFWDPRNRQKFSIKKMALSEVRVPPFYRGNWQGDYINMLELNVETTMAFYLSLILRSGPHMNVHIVYTNEFDICV